MKTPKITMGPGGELSPAKQRDPLGWPFGTLFQEDLKHQRQLQAARDKRSAKKASVDPRTVTLQAMDARPQQAAAVLQAKIDDALLVAIVGRLGPYFIIPDLAGRLTSVRWPGAPFDDWFLDQEALARVWPPTTTCEGPSFAFKVTRAMQVFGRNSTTTTGC